MAVSGETVAEVLDHILATHVVDGVDVARALGATPRSVSRWVTDRSMPRRDAEERVLELKAVTDLLLSTLRPEPARLWLRSPNAALGWRKPLDAIKEGDYRDVIGAVLVMAEGVTA